MVSKHMISVKVKNGGYKHFSVPEEVYNYIGQLEAYINHPRKSKLKERYPERFKIHGVDMSEWNEIKVGELYSKREIMARVFRYLYDKRFSLWTGEKKAEFYKVLADIILERGRDAEKQIQELVK